MIIRLSDRVIEVDKRVTSVENDISVCNDKVEKVTEDVNKRVSDADSHVVKIERDINVMTGHITKMKEDMTITAKDFTEKIYTVGGQAPEIYLGNG